ncbi:MAG TPA: chromosome segregation protein SMC [Polyangia bacterium]|nr:chromosome segregation protein SMC [Polyangia bacterium]
MRIKRLEVQGFKSFCDRSVLTFNEPITGVVGPNGCGKSNIVDAIRWCMGEQSAKHLRGKSMDDVIFAGSDSRGPLGMCEVTLVFENDGRVPLEYLAYSEIAVTRKLYRDGTSEYYLNKTPCRLRDITEFFLGTGVGAKAYSIIEQGRVGMIVTSKAEDRRALIEEAAGISKYKLKKKAAEKKMESTRQNLLRVSDVVAEIEKQLGSLRRQAQKAERYKQYKAELRDIDLWTASQRWLGLVAEERVAAEAQAEAQAAREATHGRLVSREAEIETTRLELAAEAESLSELQQGLYELDNRIKLGEAEADHEGREAGGLEERALEAKEEIERLMAQADADAAEIERIKSELAVATEAASGSDEALRTREEALRVVKEQLAALQARVEAARAEVTACKGQIVGFEAAERAGARRRDDLHTRLLRLGEDEARNVARRGELEHAVGKHARELDGLKQLKLDLADQKQRTETRVAELKEMLAGGGKALEALTTELHKRRSRRHSLDELHAKYEGFARGTRAVMQHKETRWGIRDLFADAVDAPAELDLAVEAVLGERMGAVLVESQEVGVDVIGQLKEKSEGRATFIPINRFLAGDAAAFEPGDGVRGRFLDMVTFGEDYRAVAESLFGDVLVVEDLLTALDRWRGGDKRTYVTVDGELVDETGVVTGGSREAAGAGILAQKREIRELDGIIADLETQHNDAQYRHEQLRTELNQLQAALEGMRKEAHASEMQTLTLEKDLARDREELSRLVARLNQLGDEKLDLEAQRDEAARETETAVTSLAEARTRLIALEDSVSSLGHEHIALYDELEKAQEAVTRLRVEVGAAQEKKGSLEKQLFRLTADGDEKRARRIRLEENIRTGEARAAELRAKVSATREELLRLAEERARAAEELSLKRTAHDERRGQLGQAEGELKGIRGELDGHAEEVTRLEVKRHDLQAAKQHLEEATAERYRLELWTQVHDHHLRPLAGEAEDKRAKELRDLIDRMGEINLNAIEEYNELETRFTFLSAQKTDLEKALAQLEEAIAKINRTSKKRFREVFDLVNVKFQEVFPRCFKGGNAHLRLTDEENLLESGIEIIAQPPGKKNSTVEVLSGGEKAMTAVALIFAIFLIKPSPFCLLDEVDAPLDEANVGRYNDLIREMTDRSQFIVITHNKRTMTIADTLYGVTMEEPGISKLVSVNLGTVGKEPVKKRANLTAV